jgi:hypothetical protein
MPLAGVISAENSQAVFPYWDGKPHCQAYYLREGGHLATENVTADAGCCRRAENKKIEPVSGLSEINPRQNRCEFRASCGVFPDGGNVCFPYDACPALPGLAKRTKENKGLPTPELT